MDDFESTFFNLSPSTQFPRCSSSNNSNAAVNATTSFTTVGNTDSSNLLQTQADDLDSVLLPCSSSSNQINHDDDLATLLENLPEEPLSNTTQDAESSSLDSIIGQALTSETNSKLPSNNQSYNLDNSNSKTNLVVKSENVPSEVVPFKLIKPITLSGGNIGNAAKVVPITVHSLSGQKHSIVHTMIPVGTPCVRLVSASSLSSLKQTIVKQEFPDLKPQPKLSLTDPSHLQIIVCNVVASFRVRCHLNLRQIALKSIDVIYRRESQKIVMRMREPKCTAYMWSTGKIVCTGSTSEESAKKAARKFCRRLLKIGYKIRFADFKVVNVLAVSKMPYAINIRDFSQLHQGKYCSYEPELHPGVTYRDPSSKATLKIFSTGSVTVTARSVSRAKEAIHNVFPLFREFYKFDKPNTNLEYDDALPSDTEDFS